MRLLFALPGLHRVPRGAEVAFESVAQEIARHKLPERLAIFATFPLSPVGKVSKKDLAAALVDLEDR